MTRSISFIVTGALCLALVGMEAWWHNFDAMLGWLVAALSQFNLAIRSAGGS